MWLFIAFLMVPLIEIALFIQLGGLIGLWPTLGIVVLTAVIGTFLVRSQGAMALNNVRQSFSELNDPVEPLGHGALILFAGALLLTPGFFTDAVGFALLAPPVRTGVIRYIRQRVKFQTFQMGPDPRQQQPGSHPQDRAGPVIDGEFEDLSETKTPNQGPSGWTKH